MKTRRAQHGSVEIRELLSALGRVIHVAAPEFERATLDTLADIGDRIEVAEQLGRATLDTLADIGDRIETTEQLGRTGLAKLERIGGAFRRARRKE